MPSLTLSCTKRFSNAGSRQSSMFLLIVLANSLPFTNADNADEGISIQKLSIYWTACFQKFQLHGHFSLADFFLHTKVCEYWIATNQILWQNIVNCNKQISSSLFRKILGLKWVRIDFEYLPLTFCSILWRQSWNLKLGGSQFQIFTQAYIHGCLEVSKDEPVHLMRGMTKIPWNIFDEKCDLDSVIYLMTSKMDPVCPTYIWWNVWWSRAFLSQVHPILSVPSRT